MATEFDHPDLDAFEEGRALRERYIRSPWQRWTIDLCDELERRGIFRRIGHAATDFVPFRQPADHFVRWYHGRASNFLYRLQPDEAAGFDAELHQLILEHIGSEVELSMSCTLDWGRPLRPSAARTALRWDS